MPNEMHDRHWQGPSKTSVCLGLRGHYTCLISVISILLLSGPTLEEHEGNRRAAQKALEEGQQLRAQGTAESLQKAIVKFEEAVRLFRAEKDGQGEASALNNLGLLSVSIGELQKALAYYNQALPIRRKMRDGAGEAAILNNMGRVYATIGEHQKALDHYSQALSLSQVARDQRGEVSELQNIGVVYASVGEYEKGLDYYNRALALWRVLNDRRGEAHALTLIGAVYISIGENRRALDYFSRALPLRRAVGDRRGEAHTLNHIGVAYAELGEQAKALDYYNQALPLRRAVGDRRGEAYTLNYIAAAQVSLGERSKALEYYTQALRLWQGIGDRNNEAMTLYGMARAKNAEGHLSEARAQVEAALSIVESLRTKVSSQDLRASYFALKQDYYAFYIDLLMQLHQLDISKGQNAVALEASERARARSLLEMLTEAHVDIRKGIDPALLKRERILQELINAKERYRMQWLYEQHPEEQSAGTTEKELAGLLTQHQELQAQIRSTSPGYAALMLPQPLSLAEIQHRVLDEESLLLEYALGETRSYLWAVSPSSVFSFALPKRAEIEAAARHLYELLTARNQTISGETPGQRRQRIEKAAAEYPKAAANLSRMLLMPVAKQVGNKRLVVVTEGSLQYVPFGALALPAADTSQNNEDASRADTAFEPLLLKHEIVNLPSASTLAVLRREVAGRKPAPLTVAVLADPVFQRDDERVMRIQARKRTGSLPADSKGTRIQDGGLTRSAWEHELLAAGRFLSRLSFSRQEADAILALVPPEQRMKAVDFAASRATATSPELARYRLVHFATHGLINSTHPELSGIVLSLVDEHGNPQDGFLRLPEIYNLNLPADLVVLSACRTALGKQVKGEGLVGLIRGFMYAGASRIVASLWKVDDRATAELMKRFYKEMLGQDRLSPSAALRAAQLSMWKETRWKSPYYWAAFVLQGEWR